MLPRIRPGQCLRFTGGQEGGLSPGQIVRTASCASQPSLAALPFAAPTRTASSVSGFWIRQIGAFGNVFRRCFFAAMGCTMEACPLGEQFCWHPVLPDPNPPPRCAPRPDPPVVWPGFGCYKCMNCTEVLLNTIAFWQTKQNDSSHLYEFFVSRTCLACKKFTQTNKHRFTSHEQGQRTLVVHMIHMINQWSTTG